MNLFYCLRNNTGGYYYVVSRAIIISILLFLAFSLNAQMRIVYDGSNDIVRTNDLYKWEDSMVPALSVKTGATAPTLGTFGPSGGLQCYLFQPSSVNDQCWFSVQMPHAWASGNQDIRAHIHWTRTAAPDAPGNTGVVWGLEYSYAAIGGTFQAPTTLRVTNVISDTNWKHQLAQFTAITNETYGISGIINCRMFREGTSASDTYASDVAFIGFDIHFLQDGLGSTDETSK